MKYSVATVATLAAGVLAAAPEFTNIEFDVEEGKKFEITFNGCDEGCTIVLQNGPSSNLKSVETLTTEATDGSFIWTPEDLPSDTYAFKIFPTGDETDFNYSKQFEYEGTGSPSSTAASSPASTKATSSSAESTSAESTSADTTMTTSSSAETSSAASTTSESMASTTSPASTSTTTPPSAAGTTRYSPIALIAGAVAAIAFLN